MIHRIFILFFVLLCISCSKSDDEASEYDPVYALEYTRLQSLDQISENVFYYAGIKVGDQKTSLLIPEDKSCRAAEFFGPAYDRDFPTLDFAYIKFAKGQLGCESTESAYFTETRLVEEGKLLATIRRGYPDRTSIPEAHFLVLKERIFKGLLEIGFQGDYLRIEDRMSNYKREDPNEKVYLYFKK